jgi:exosome complex component RRP42
MRDSLIAIVRCCSIYLFPFSSAHASPKFEGRGGEELSSELSRILDRACSNKSAVDLKSLSITSGQQCWVLYVDALVRDSDCLW